MKIEIIIPKSTTGKAYYRTLEDVVYLGYMIPKGFVTDGATVPRAFHSIFPPIDTYFLAALLHDYLLANGYGWRHANKMFKLGLIDLNVPWWKQKIILASVNIASLFIKVP